VLNYLLDNLDSSHYVKNMERLLTKTDLREIRQDHVEVRSFVKEISLKLRTRRSRNEEDCSSLYEFITNKDKLA